MRKGLSILLIGVFIMTVTSAWALPRPVEKLTKGTEEVIKSPLVIYDHTKKEMGDHKVLGLIKGLIESPFHVVKKAGKGLIDVATFPIE